MYIILIFSYTGNYAKMVFGSSNGQDLFTSDAIKAMCTADEQLIRSHSKFPDTCHRCESSKECPASWSIGTYVALLNDKRTCEDITDMDVLNTKSLLQRCAPHYINHTMCANPPCETTEVPTECLRFGAVYHIFHFLAPVDFALNLILDSNADLRTAVHIAPILLGYRNENLTQMYLDRFHGRQFVDKQITLKAVDFQNREDLFEIFLPGDSLYLCLGLLSVFVIVWLYTGSLLVTSATCLTVTLSLSMSYFCYFVVFKRDFFPFVNVVSVILVIGVGADDTFVYFDLWRKSLVEKNGANLNLVVQDTLHHATVTMLVTSVTTAGSLYASIISNIAAVKCFGLFAGTAILMNFLLTLTLLPAIIIIQYRLMSCLNRVSKSTFTTKCCRTVGKIHGICFTPIQLFFKRVLPVVIMKLRYIWLVLLGAIGIGGILVVFVYPRLSLPSTGDFQILREDNYLEQWERIYKHMFKFTESTGQRMTGYILFGVKPTENGDSWNTNDRGSIVMDKSFEFYSKEHQEWMLQFCNDLRRQEFYHGDRSNRGLRMCFMESLIEYMERSYSAIGSRSSPCCCSKHSFPYESDIFHTCLRECSIAGQCSYGVRFHSDKDEFAAVAIVFETSTFVTYDSKIIHDFWKETNRWVDQRLKEAPKSLQEGWFIAVEQDQLYFYDLQQSLGKGTPTALGITLSIVLLILTCTILNIVLAFYAILTITFAVFVTIGSLVLLGWELNIFESVILTLCVGLCVDFTIHCGVAYRLAPAIYEQRSQRAEFSITTMTGAVSVAALSTLLAGVCMLVARINAFYQLGLFLVLVMSVSWTYSTFFFQSLCTVLGPQGNFGDLTNIDWIFECIRSKKEKIQTDKKLQIPSRYVLQERSNNEEIKIKTIFDSSKTMELQWYENPMLTFDVDIDVDAATAAADDDSDVADDRLRTSTIVVVWNPFHKILPPYQQEYY